jgi:hypothetical protein
MCGTKNRTKIILIFFLEQINKAFLLFLKIQLEEMGKNISLFGSTFKSILWSSRSYCWSLKTKWGAIKHDITKFIYCCDSMLSLNELGTSLEDVLQKALEPTSTQRLIFCMNSFWLFFKDIPRWVDIETKLKKNLLMKLKMPITSTMEVFEECYVMKSFNDGEGTPQVPTRHPMGMNTITQRHWRTVLCMQSKSDHGHGDNNFEENWSFWWQQLWRKLKLLED